MCYMRIRAAGTRTAGATIFSAERRWRRGLYRNSRTQIGVQFGLLGLEIARSPQSDRTGNPRARRGHDGAGAVRISYRSSNRHHGLRRLRNHADAPTVWIHLGAERAADDHVLPSRVRLDEGIGL